MSANITNHEPLSADSKPDIRYEQVRILIRDFGLCMSNADASHEPQPALPVCDVNPVNFPFAGTAPSDAPSTVMI